MHALSQSCMEQVLRVVATVAATPSELKEGGQHGGVQGSLQPSAGFTSPWPQSLIFEVYLRKTCCLPDTFRMAVIEPSPGAEAVLPPEPGSFLRTSTCVNVVLVFPASHGQFISI